MHNLCIYNISWTSLHTQQIRIIVISASGYFFIRFLALNVRKNIRFRNNIRFRADICRISASGYFFIRFFRKTDMFQKIRKFQIYYTIVWAPGHSYAFFCYMNVEIHALRYLFIAHYVRGPLQCHDMQTSIFSFYIRISKNGYSRYPEKYPIWKVLFLGYSSIFFK